jgi:hypothetical protein
MVHSIVSKFEKIWLSHTLNIIWKPKKSLFSKRKRAITVNVKYTVIKLNLYFMVHSNVWKFEKIWLSSTLIIIRKPKVWRTDGRTNVHEDPYIPPPPRLSAGVYKPNTVKPAHDVTSIKRSSFPCPVIENFTWIEPLLRGQLSYKATFSFVPKVTS